MQFGQPDTPRQIIAKLPDADLAALRDALLPMISDLDKERAADVARTDHLLIRAMGGAALVGLVFGIGVARDIMLGLFLAILSAIGALFFIWGAAMDGPRATARTRIVDAIAARMMGFRVDPDPRIGRDEMDALMLFSRVRKVTVDLCLVGERDGRMVMASRIGLMFGSDYTRKEKQGGGVTFVMVEVAMPETAGSEQMTVVMSTDADFISKASQWLMHRTKAVPTGDADFDTRYTVSGDVARLTPALRDAFVRLEAEARCGKTGLTEVPAGTGLRPWVVILPGKLVVLTPLTKFDGAFEPPPFWDPLDPDTLIPAFASDLAILNGYVNAALSLPFGEIA